MTTTNPTELKYAKSHEWVRDEGEFMTIGITHHAQELLGELVFVELPALGKNVSAGSEIAVVESVKAASDVYAPLGGEVISINSRLEAEPDLVNKDPYGEGWLFKLKASNKEELDLLLSADDYSALG